MQELVQEILTPNPQQRPTLHEIVDHVFFTSGTVPGYIPASAHDMPPDFRHITRSVSQSNLSRLKRNALLDEDQMTSVHVPAATQQSTIAGGASAQNKLKGMSTSLAQQEKEFQKAVQPGSPISALLSSARQPLLVAPLSGQGDQPLIRKLQAVKQGRSPARPGRLGTGGLHNIEEREEEDMGAKQEELRRKELESQKARIVAQMVPESAKGLAFGLEDQENIPPAGRGEYKMRERLREKDTEAAKEEVKTAAGLPTSTSVPLKVNGFDAAAHTLTTAFDAKAAGKLFRDPREDAGLQDPKVFIVSWVDYCNKYGMGYALTDGSVGVHFNDSTTIVLSPDKQ